MLLRSMDALLEAARVGPSYRMALVPAEEADGLQAMVRAAEFGLITPVAVGEPKRIQAAAREAGISLKDVEILEEGQPERAVARAIHLTREGSIQILMKGLVHTDVFLRAVLDRERGLRTKRLVSHVAVCEVPGYDRLFILTDAAVNIAPDLGRKLAIIRNAADVARVLGIDPPRVALLAAVEKVNFEEMPATTDAAILSKMSAMRQIPYAIVDGPLALDNAVSLEAAKIKGISGPVAGRADILVAPEIEVGNVLYKALVHFARARIAGIIAGATVPIVVTSRSDPEFIKHDSIALANYLADAAAEAESTGRVWNAKRRTLS